MIARRLLMLMLCGVPIAANAGDRVVLLIENRSDNAAAPAELQPALKAALSRKGYEVVCGPEVDQALAAAGVAHPESMPAAAAASLLDSFKARRLVAVTVYFLLERQKRDVGPRANPAVGLSAKGFVADRVAWRNSLGMIDEEDLAHADDRRRRKPLVQQASARLLWSFPRGAGASVASADEEWNEITGYLPPEAAAGEKDYDVVIERLRATRTGPRFRLKLGKQR